MRFAIDRYAVGTEKEVSASEFEGQSYIPARKERFYCPECGELVYIRNGQYMYAALSGTIDKPN